MITILIVAVTRVAVRGSFSETWTDHDVVGGLVMCTPGAFSEEQPAPGTIRMPGMHQVAQESKSCYVAAIAVDIPPGGGYDLDAGMKGVMDLVAGKPDCTIANQVVSSEPVLGLPAQRCRFDVTHAGQTKPVAVLVFNSPSKAWGVLAIAETPDLERIVGSLKFAPGAEPSLAAR